MVRRGFPVHAPVFETEAAEALDGNFPHLAAPEGAALQSTPNQAPIGDPNHVTAHLPPIGFWSYTSSDDEAASGRLSQLRALLAKELQLKIGREPKVKIFQDVATIKHGQDWEKAIHAALNEASFLIPILTPAFLQSEWCCREVMHFHEREKALGRDDLIFPLHYVTLTPDRPGACFNPKALEVLQRHQWIDFRPMRTRNPESEGVATLLDTFTDSISAAIFRVVSAPVAQLVVQPPPAPAVPVPPVATPRPKPPPALLTDGPGLPEMVLIPAGRFTMGVPEAESRQEKLNDNNARPLHEVVIGQPFYLGKYPVTRGQYAAFVKATDYKDDGGRWRSVEFQNSDDHPVVRVSADDAETYAKWLSADTGQTYRLPTEAEWEYAARAGTTTARFWGDDFKAHAAYAHNDGNGTAPVGGGRQANGFGLVDMLGNVWEWCADPWHGDYDGAPGDGSAWEGGDPGRGVLRGGSWNNDPRILRAGVRYYIDRGYRNGVVGFRLARTLSGPSS